MTRGSNPAPPGIDERPSPPPNPPPIRKRKIADLTMAELQEEVGNLRGDLACLEIDANRAIAQLRDRVRELESAAWNERDEQEQEGCGGDAILDRLVR